MEHKDLFSGIGGFALAARMVWGEQQKPRLFCEKEPYARRVLNKNFPGVPCVEDIRDLRGDQSVTTDLITAGFPCQPFSLAGKRAGQEDDRYLWPETLRVIHEYHPRWVIGENVPGIINLALDDVLASLEGEGYTTETFIIPACAINAPHKRERVWIVAYSDNGHDQSSQSKRPGVWGQAFGGRTHINTGGADIKSEVMAGPSGERLEKREGVTGNAQQEFASAERICHGNVSNPQSNGIQESEGENREQRRTQISESGLDALRNSWGSFWEVEPGICGVADGVSHRVDRLRGLGNAIVPHVAAVLMAGIREVDRVYNKRMVGTKPARRAYR